MLMNELKVEESIPPSLLDNKFAVNMSYVKVFLFYLTPFHSDNLRNK